MNYLNKTILKDNIINLYDSYLSEPLIKNKLHMEMSFQDSLYDYAALGSFYYTYL